MISFTQVIVLFSIGVSVAHGNFYRVPRQSNPTPPKSYNPYEPARNYDFEWAVKDDYSGNNYGQQESRQDGKTVTGSYYVRLPDNRLQKVSYTVTPEGGYDAVVSYEGEASTNVHSAAPVQPSKPVTTTSKPVTVNNLEPQQSVAQPIRYKSTYKSAPKPYSNKSPRKYGYRTISSSAAEPVVSIVPTPAPLKELLPTVEPKPQTTPKGTIRRYSYNTISTPTKKESIVTTTPYKTEEEENYTTPPPPSYRFFYL